MLYVRIRVIHEMPNNLMWKYTERGAFVDALESGGEAAMAKLSCLVNRPLLSRDVSVALS